MSLNFAGFVDGGLRDYKIVYGKDLENEEYFSFYKVGYSKGEEDMSRIYGYLQSNPAIKVLLTIPGCTLMDESSLHTYLRDTLGLETCEFGREWHKDRRVVDIVKSLGREGISKLPFYSGNQVSALAKDEFVSSFLGFVLCSPFFYNPVPSQVILEEVKSLVSEYGLKTLLSCDLNDLFISHYGKDVMERFREWESRQRSKVYVEGDKDLNNRITDFLEVYNSSNRYVDRMRMLCETDLPDDIILDQVLNSDQVKLHYITLGRRKCKALGYNITYINDYIAKESVDRTNLIEGIHSEFKVGETYLVSNVALKLKEIYEKYNYISK